jgi:hypothetical protein
MSVSIGTYGVYFGASPDVVLRSAIDAPHRMVVNGNDYVKTML